MKEKTACPAQPKSSPFVLVFVLFMMLMPQHAMGAEKITIGKDYVLPHTLKEAGLSADNLTIDETVLPKIVRPLGYDAGIRTLERTIEGVARKIAREIVEGKHEHFHLTLENIKHYLPTY